MHEIQVIQRPQIDIILPVYNPLADWEKTVLNSIQAIAKSRSGKCDVSMIIVNDGSDGLLDQGVAYIKDGFERTNFISYSKNRGKGYALKRAMSESNSDYTIYTDIDFPYTQKSLLDVIDILLDGKVDVVAGIRGESYYSNIPKQRLKISRLLRRLNKTLYKLPTDDTQAGLKGLSKKARALFTTLKTNRYLIDLEFLKKAKRNKLDIRLLEIELKETTELRKMPLKNLIRELGSFIRILFS